MWLWKQFKLLWINGWAKKMTKFMKKAKYDHKCSRCGLQILKYSNYMEVRTDVENKFKFHLLCEDVISEMSSKELLKKFKR